MRKQEYMAMGLTVLEYSLSILAKPLLINIFIVLVRFDLDRPVIVANSLIERG